VTVALYAIAGPLSRCEIQADRVKTSCSHFRIGQRSKCPANINKLRGRIFMTNASQLLEKSSTNLLDR
jgi:hypothetical protein